MHDDTAQALRAHAQLKSAVLEAQTLEDLEAVVRRHLSLFEADRSHVQEPEEEEFFEIAHELFDEFLRMGQHRDRTTNIRKAAACMTISLIALVRLKGGGSTLTSLVHEEIRQRAERLLARQG